MKSVISLSAISHKYQIADRELQTDKSLGKLKTFVQSGIVWVAEEDLVRYLRWRKKKNAKIRCFEG